MFQFSGKGEAPHQHTGSRSRGVTISQPHISLKRDFSCKVSGLIPQHFNNWEKKLMRAEAPGGQSSMPALLSLSNTQPEAGLG